LLWRSNESRRYGGTNLARTSTVAGDAVGASIFESWIRHLIDSREVIPDGFMSDLREPLEFPSRYASRCLWLEGYDAFTLYELARNGWHFEAMRGSSKEDKVDEVAGWEAGRTRVRLFSRSLYSELLALILPRVALKREMDENGRLYLLPPVSDWRQVLKSCHDFLSSPVEWPPFAVYQGRISEQLYTASEALNERFAQRLSQFGHGELLRLVRILDSILRGRAAQEPAEVSEEDSALLQRAIDVAGDLEVSWDWHRPWRLDSFAKKNS